jgi:hypothetical protein
LDVFLVYALAARKQSAAEGIFQDRWPERRQLYMSKDLATVSSTFERRRHPESGASGGNSTSGDLSLTKTKAEKVLPNVGVQYRDRAAVFARSARIDVKPRRLDERTWQRLIL